MSTLVWYNTNLYHICSATVLSESWQFPPVSKLKLYCKRKPCLFPWYYQALTISFVIGCVFWINVLLKCQPSFHLQHPGGWQQILIKNIMVLQKK